MARASVCLPHGFLVLLAGTTAVFACIFSYTAGFACQLFVSGPSSDYNGGYGPWTAQGTKADLGRTVIDDTKRCFAYKDLFYNVSDELDGPMKFARALSIFIALLAFPAMVLATAPACVTFDKPTVFHFTAGFSFALAVLNLLLLSAMGSKFCQEPAYCSIGMSGILGAVGALLWLITGVIYCVMNKTPRAEALADVPQTPEQAPDVETTITKTKNPDGTVLVTTRTIKTDPRTGQKTVTEKNSIVDEDGNAVP